jgi:hypothetical protein
MRTKTLILAAAALAAGLATSMAQTVYSVNIVGYANNTTLTNAIGLNRANGYNMIANQFDVDGTGTNNTLATVFPTNLPANTTILAWNGAGYTQDKWLASGKWASTVNTIVNTAIQPGHGFFLQCPSNSPAPATLLTLGNVLVNKTNTFPYVHGFQIMSPAVPATGGISTVFGYTPTKGDVLLVWSYASQSFSQKKYTTSWLGGEPIFAVGQAALLNATNAGTWTQIFTVQ